MCKSCQILLRRMSPWVMSVLSRVKREIKTPKRHPPIIIFRFMWQFLNFQTSKYVCIDTQKVSRKFGRKASQWRNSVGQLVFQEVKVIFGRIVLQVPLKRNLNRNFHCAFSLEKYWLLFWWNECLIHSISQIQINCRWKKCNMTNEKVKLS